jgi:butyryl-CoA dehydrogenase
MTLFTAPQQNQLIHDAEDADRSADWPATSWQTLVDVGALRRSIPVEYGGAGLSPIELQEGMEEIARCCLTTAFVLSQREAAVRNLLRGTDHLKQRYLPLMASGEAFLTVGLSQLTTSRQHLGPALRATPLPSGGYQLDGEIPWVTGADQAAAIVAGATLPDATQLLVVIPAEKLSGMIELPLPLAALVGSRTSLIHCREVQVEPEDVLAGPTENVLGKLGGGGLDTSCLAIGLAAAAAEFIQNEALNRRELAAIADRYDVAVKSNRRRLHELADSSADPGQTLALRLDCTKLALRATQASLMIAKGNGFVAPHPAQRWARQATFFLVWSCPRPVAEGVLADLSDW